MYSNYKFVLSSMAFLIIVNHVKSFPMPTDKLVDSLMNHAQDLLINGTECMNKVGTTDEDLGMLMKKKLPSTRTGQCFVACMLEKLDMIQSGVFQQQAIYNIAKMILGEDENIAHLIGEVTEVCTKRSGSADQCEMVGKISSCVEGVVHMFRSELKKQYSF